MNGKWQYFLNSLATVGGNLLVLVLFVLLLLGLVLYVLHDTGANAQIVTVVLSTFSGFAGALLQALRGRSTDTNPSTGGGTSTSSTTTEVTTPVFTEPK
jgi:hypothetical protein